MPNGRINRRLYDPQVEDETRPRIGPVDGAMLIDFAGNRWQYYADLNQWINIGRAAGSQVVNYQRNGILTPDMAQLLDDIDTNNNRSYFKISPTDAYYYMLQSPSSYYVFSIENSNLRIELNRNAVANLLRCAACQGAKGRKGVTGADGAAGSAGPAEQFWVPSTDGDTLSLVEELPTPLDTEVSLRLTNPTSGDLLEIWLDNAGQWSVRSGSTIQIKPAESEVKLVDGTFTAILAANGEWGGDWLAKVRQRGPQGWAGDAGETFIEIQESQLYALEATRSIASVRKSRDYNIYFVQQSIDDLPVASLRPYNSTQVQDACVITTLISYEDDATSTDKFGAIEPAVSSKEIRRWVFDPVTEEFDELTLQYWTPDPSCQGGVQYKWWVQFDGSSSELPVQIEVAPVLEQQCCQEDFFFCPNLGTADCGVEPKGPWKWPPSAPPTGQDPNWEVYGKPPRWLPL